MLNLSKNKKFVKLCLMIVMSFLFAMVFTGVIKIINKVDPKKQTKELMQKTLESWDGTENNMDFVVGKIENLKDGYGRKFRLNKYVRIFRGGFVGKYKYMVISVRSAGEDGIFYNKDDICDYESNSLEMVGEK